MADARPESLLTCPDCLGQATVAAFVDGACGGWFEPAMKCHRCNGSGQITARQVAWLVVGRAHRNVRVERRESIVDCARRLGVTAVELSAMENGRADPRRLAARRAEQHDG